MSWGWINVVSMLCASLINIFSFFRISAESNLEHSRPEILRTSVNQGSELWRSRTDVALKGIKRWCWHHADWYSVSEAYRQRKERTPVGNDGVIWKQKPTFMASSRCADMDEIPRSRLVCLRGCSLFGISWCCCSAYDATWDFLNPDSRYENVPIQIYWKFHLQKQKIFR